MKTIRIPILVLTLLLATSTGASAEGFLQPLDGWKILAQDFDPDHPLDIISFEWDYFMVHDENFNGIVGYVVANPRERLGDIIQIVPNGANVALVGERYLPARTVQKCFLWMCWNETVAAHYEKPVADYHALGTQNAQFGVTERSFFGGDINSRYGQMDPLPGGAPDGSDALRLRGRSEHWEWDLLVWQGMQDRNWQRLAPNAPLHHHQRQRLFAAWTNLDC